MSKKMIGVLIKLVCTVLLFVALFRPETFGLRADMFGGVTPRKMLDELGDVRMSSLVPWLLFAALVKLTGMMAGVVRWRLLLQGQGLRIPFWYLTQSWFVGRFFGIFLPSTIGLDGYRLYDSARYTGEVVKCTTVVAVEKLIGFVALTFLLFLTFPLGFSLLNINKTIFAVIVAALAGFVTVAFLLLLNPRVIQVLVAVIPTPKAISGKINKLGHAATAYSGNRALLLKATLCGLLVHLGTCFMYFGTMMSIRAENTSLFDILFAAPVMIYGTVLGPSIGGEGIREIVFVTLLRGTTGAAAAALFSHLGWWIGEVVPFLIGMPILILRSRAPKEKVEADLARMRKSAVAVDVSLHLTPEEISSYRAKVVNCALAGLIAGLVAGAIIGIGEAHWLVRLGGFAEWSAYWWGPLAYGIIFSGAGLGLAGAVVFLSLLADRFPKAAIAFPFCLGVVLTGGALLIGAFRFWRDVLAQGNISASQLLPVVGLALGAGVAAAIVSFLAISFARGGRIRGIVAGLGVYLAIVAAGFVAAARAPEPQPPTFAPARKATGPNIIMVVADAQRADYLPMYSDAATAKTPNLEGLIKDGALFKKAFSQASWTKPAFATIFSGRYPESHTATTKTAILPDEVTTFPELLFEGGYYTKGFANNPNITSAFNFGQGFVDYVDLKPDLYFGAKPSSTKLFFYEILRRVRQHKMLSRKMVVTRFYQPAEVVTREALAWLDGNQAPKDAPFFLFLHYMDPHDPFMDHDKKGVGYARVRMEHPDPARFLDAFRKAYNDEIEYMDTQLGLLFDGLRDRGLYDDTVILFTGDHGEEFHDHDGWWHGQTLYDELIHVPMMLKLPGNAGAGTTNTGLARHIDVGPTLLALAGLQKAPEMPGMSIIDAQGRFLNDSTRHVYAENNFEGIELQAVRTQDAKVIRANQGNKRNLAPIEYYALDTDPAEKTNLAGTADEKEAKLNLMIDQMIASIQTGAAEPALTEEITEEQRQQMEDLGYLGE